VGFFRPGGRDDTPLRLRLRLTLFYGVLSVVSGAVLLVITYALLAGSDVEHVSSVRHSVPVPSLPDGTLLRPVEPESAVRACPACPVMGVVGPDPTTGQVNHLLLQSGLALAIMGLISLGLGWLIAGRVLHPVRTMTTMVRQISASNVHERLAVTGPRDELKDLADTIDGLLGRLETALDDHKRFVANAAHELRTPLTVEHALLEEPLIDRDATLESFRSNFERLLAISQQRGRLLESLLTLSSSEHGREHYRPLDLAGVVETVLSGRRTEIERRGLRVDPVIEPATILGDPVLIERLITNLLDNALHYNVPGGWVEIGTRAEDGTAVIFVVNSGPKVPAAQVEQLIEPFQRLHRVADDDHHGLGLSIVRAIAVAHDATLSVRSRMAGGLLVEVAVPVAVSPVPAFSG
jgi:signal transduction histidine kinase